MIRLNAIVWSALIAFLFTGCGETQTQEAFHTEGYVAVLKLDSTELLITDVRSHLDIPWEITVGPDGWIWFTEQKGMVNRLNPETGYTNVILSIPDVLYKKSLGLLSMAIHPDFDANPFVCLHYTFEIQDGDLNINSRIVRYTYRNGKLVEPFILLDSIPGKTYHNGSRMAISPDRKLFFSMGDAGEKELSQDPFRLNGKTLRLNLDGTIPSDNPYPNSPVWSLGHRNPQGLVFDDKGVLYSSEHGVNNDDEINLIEKGQNYGWPFVEGSCDLPTEKDFCADKQIHEPIYTWSPTVAVAGLDYYNHTAIPEWQNSLLLANLKGRALRVLNLDQNGKAVSREHIFFQKRFGRIRDICVTPNGDVYFSSSNLDWHPQLQPWMYDSLPPNGDHIYRIQPMTEEIRSKIKELASVTYIKEDSAALKMDLEVWDFNTDEKGISMGKGVYLQQCAQCHQPNGGGVKGLFPPLTSDIWVTGDKSKLIQVLLKGLSEPIEIDGVTYEQEMPSFAYLSDEDLANVLSYIRTSFGNDAGAVIPGEVHEERKILE